MVSARKNVLLRLQEQHPLEQRDYYSQAVHLFSESAVPQRNPQLAQRLATDGSPVVEDFAGV